MRCNVKAALAIISCILLSGCSQYHTDIPEFTTEQDRSSDFVPVTFEESHETEMPEDLQELKNNITCRVKSIEERRKAGGIDPSFEEKFNYAKSNADEVKSELANEEG